MRIFLLATVIGFMFVQAEAMNYTRNGCVCTKWTKIEIKTLKELVNTHGNEWKKIQSLYFPHRTTNELKCKYNYENRRSKKINFQKLNKNPEIKSLASTADNLKNNEYFYIDLYNSFIDW